MSDVVSISKRLITVINFRLLAEHLRVPSCYYPAYFPHRNVKLQQGERHGSEWICDCSLLINWLPAFQAGLEFAFLDCAGV